MNKILLLKFLFIANNLFAQADSSWKEFIIEPDLLVYFPGTPGAIVNSAKNSYKFEHGDVILKVTSEKSPINYYGRTIKEVDDEYYGTLTAKTLSSKQKLVKEDNFKFENHNVREIVYTDTVNEKPCIVTLEVLNVTGFEEAMYKFYIIDFKKRNPFPDEYRPFFSNWDLYYKFENNLNENRENENKVLKEAGFILEGEQKTNKAKWIIAGVLIITLLIIVIKLKKKKAGR